MEQLPLSGRQLRLRSGAYEADLASVGASLRTLRHAGRDLVVPYAADEVRPGFRGMTLAPWPNRVVGGRYRWRDEELQLAVSEPSRGAALHGLVGWLDFEVTSASESSATLTATIEAQAGYPWRVLVETTYRLADDGLTQSVRGTNLGAEPAPWGAGPHPYLVAGPGTVDDWILELPADQVLDVRRDCLSPLGLSVVDLDEPERFDFRVPRPVGTVQIDHAFTDLPDIDAEVSVRVTTARGEGVAMTWDPTVCPWVQIHTTDLPGGPATPGHRGGLAVEPMTCAPDAFNHARYEHDTGLTVLAPGASASASWRISALPA